MPPNNFLTDEQVRETVRTETRNAVQDAMKHLDTEVRNLRLLSRAALTAEEVGHILGCNGRQVRDFHVPRGLRAYKPGKQLAFLPDDVQAYIRAHPADGSGSGAKAAA